MGKRVTHEDKIGIVPKGNRVNQWWDSDANEHKEAINENEAILDEHVNNNSNPHSLTKEQIGLGNVDNTSDADKPISNATSLAITEIDNKAEQNKTDLENLSVSNIAGLQGALDDKATSEEVVGLELELQSITTSEQAENEFYIFAGDSNMTGINSGDSQLDDVDFPNNKIFEVSLGQDRRGILQPAPENELMIARPWSQAGGPLDNISMCLPFCKRRLELEKGINKIAYVNTATSATDFNTDGWLRGGDRYNRMIRLAKSFLAKHPEFKLKGVLWHDTAFTINNLQRDITDLVNGIREDLGVFVPFITGTPLASWADDTEERIAMQNIIKNTSNFVEYSSVVIMDDLVDSYDSIHFGANDLRIAGVRYADQLQKLLFQNKNKYVHPNSYVSNNSNRFELIHDTEIVGDIDRGDVLKVGAVGKSTSMLLHSNRYTKMAWVKVLSSNPNGSIISGFNDVNSNSHYFGFGGYSNNITSGNLQENGAPFNDTNFQSGRWYHCAITFNGSMFSVYLDGVLISTGSSNITVSSKYQLIELGRFSDGSGVNYGLECLMDDIRVYPFDLTAENILNIFEETNFGNLSLNITNKSGGIIGNTDGSGGAYILLDPNSRLTVNKNDGVSRGIFEARADNGWVIERSADGQGSYPQDITKISWMRDSLGDFDIPNDTGALSGNKWMSIIFGQLRTRVTIGMGHLTDNYAEKEVNDNLATPKAFVRDLRVGDSFRMLEVNNATDTQNIKPLAWDSGTKQIVYTEQEEEVYLDLVNGFDNWSPSFKQAKATKRGNLVKLSGLIRTPSNLGTTFLTIATLPTGFRPALESIHSGLNQSNIVQFRVQSNGNISLHMSNVNGSTPLPDAWLSLENITFTIND